MLDETGLLGFHKKEEPQVQPPPAPVPERKTPKLFSPDKMTPAEMIGAGVVMLGNIAFVSWWAMNEGTTEMIEMIDTPAVPVIPMGQKPTELPLVVPPLAAPASPEVQTSAPILEVAEVNQEGTFKEAFDAARAQVGPGGVFEWRGQWYNTYTAEEWTGMEPAGKEDYATLVKPFVDNDSSLPHAIEYDVSGQDKHVEVANIEDDNHPSDLHHADQTAHLMPPPMDTHLDTLDDFFLNT